MDNQDHDETGLKAEETAGQTMDDPQSRMMMDPQDTPTPQADNMSGGQQNSSEENEVEECK